MCLAHLSDEIHFASSRKVAFLESGHLTEVVVQPERRTQMCEVGFDL